MERVYAPDRVGAPLGDRTGDPAGHVRRDQFDLFAALLPERVEEREHRPAVTAGRGPHQPAGVVVHDDGQVSLSLAVADLVNPDPPQPVQEIHVSDGLGSDPLEDRADRPPRDAHQLRHGALRRVHRQPRDLILERAREPRVMPRPRHRADHDTVAPARHPRRPRLNERERRPEVQRTPAPASLAEIETRRSAPAHTTTIPLPPIRPNAHDHPSLAAEPHILDHRSSQPEQPRPYPDTAHAASPPRIPALKKPETLGSARRAPLPQPLTHPRKRQERPISRARPAQRP